MHQQKDVREGTSSSLRLLSTLELDYWQLEHAEQRAQNFLEKEEEEKTLLQETLNLWATLENGLIRFCFFNQLKQWKTVH